MLPFHGTEEKAYLGIGYYAVFADAENKEAVIDLLKFMTSDEQQVAFNSEMELSRRSRASATKCIPMQTAILRHRST